MFDGFVGAVIGGFEAAGGTVFWIGAMMEAAVGERSAQPFMEEQEEQRDLDAARPWIGGWALRHKTLLGLVDRGSILLVVYAAFSEGVTQGIWRQLSLSDLERLAAVDAALLAAVLFITTFSSRLLGFSRDDEVTIVFCGSKKSLASGLPMATVLLAGQEVELIVLPLMLFHQIQLMVCAALAKRYANAGRGAAAPAPGGEIAGAAP